MITGNRIHITLMTCVLALLPLLTVPMAGCSTSGETVALAIAGTTGATLIGTQVATESKIQVEVDVFIPEVENDSRFKLSREIALRRQIQQMQLNDIGSFQAIAAQLEGPMKTLADQREQAGGFVENLALLMAPTIVEDDDTAGEPGEDAESVADIEAADGGEADAETQDRDDTAEVATEDGDADSAADVEGQRTVDGLRAWLTRQDTALKQWELFEKRLKQAKAKSSPDKKDFEDLRVRLSALRDALVGLSRLSEVPEEYLRWIAATTSTALDYGVETALDEAGLNLESKLDLRNKILNTYRESDQLGDLLDTLTEQRVKNKTVKEQLALAVSTAFQYVLELKVELDEDEKEDFVKYKRAYASSPNVVDAIVEALNDDSFSPMLAELAVTLDRDTVARAISITDPAELSTLFLDLPDYLFVNNFYELDSLTTVIQTAATIAYRVTYSALLADVNLGPIVNEVMQSVMTVYAIDVITNPDYEKRWQRFAEASSTGRTGNHDVVIYFENMGKPILKSSAFDPTKFVVANGQLFQQAFFALADVYGLPTGAAEGTQADTNIIKLRKQRDETLAKAKADSNKLQEALRSLLNTDDYSDSTKVQNMITEAANKLIKAEQPAQKEEEGGDEG